ncbi:hypothetical protein OAM78_04275 [Alphaproteobacteria bacterium]|nr:hypothetical protein [Alphaproteobacteria bacterium]
MLPLDAASLGLASLGLAGLGVAGLGVASLVVAGLGSINLVAPPSRRPKDYALHRCAPSPSAPPYRRTPSPSHPFTVAPLHRRTSVPPRPPNTADAVAPIKSRKYQQTTSIKQQKAAP